jgi:hypothetical protein
MMSTALILPIAQLHVVAPGQITSSMHVKINVANLNDAGMQANKDPHA